ncbi:MAG: DNA primase [Chryseobacterium sp.]|uniref:toprim domain-containing protein n=1 Tax=Chryseobacterium sp. Y16C TaxID=2920939 RepID=UPI000DB4BFD8|nr:toprim domain-containing protein [Chryseobacterium sp. Y16C]PZU89066.1 MAG: DNA primase [Chryseobacterium sp.]UMQ41634.1 toprim domain-containing protein [Chryseobacterium sp. Y16C]
MNCEEIKQKIDIRTVLEMFGRFPVKENKRSAFYFALDREEKTPSLSVDFIKNKAFDFGTGKSYDVISIVQQIKKCSVSEALKYLSSSDFSYLNSIHQEKKGEIQLKDNYKILEIKEIIHPALIRYLKSRKVLEQKHMVHEIHYERQGKTYFGIGFLNDSGDFEFRNAYSKICLGSKDVSWIKVRNNSKNEVAVFEGFFDYLTFRNLSNEDHPDCDCLILNSTAMLFKAKEKLKDYDKIILFLDNDANGKSVRSIIEKEYKNVEDSSLMYADYKDLNQWFCVQKQVP